MGNIFLKSLFLSPMSVLVLLIIIGMIVVSWRWVRIGQKSVDLLAGGLGVIRKLGKALSKNHPVRKRLESAPIVELSLEEISKLMGTEQATEAVEGLLVLQRRTAWIERFAQASVHLGILGTVIALVSSDMNNLDTFRGNLPIALGTTFWGLSGTLVLSGISGWVENEMERTSQLIRRALLDSFDDEEFEEEEEETEEEEEEEEAEEEEEEEEAEEEEAEEEEAEEEEEEPKVEEESDEEDILAPPLDEDLDLLYEENELDLDAAISKYDANEN